MKLGFSAVAILSILAHAGVAHAGLNDGSCSDAQKSSVTTSHEARIAGKVLAYSATAGFLEVTAADGSSKACVFYVSYTVPDPRAPRPLTFAFNGGPGSASVWLHLGLLGPKRADMGSDGLTPPRTPELVPNEFSLLDTTDIVMIDPVATGFSRTEGGASGDKFFGVKNDYASIGSFVRNYLNFYNRWISPKFILGESYGGIRGSLLANYLQSELQIRVAGLVLISPALSETTFFNAPDNLVPYWTYFPSFAATAWFHKKAAARYQAMSVEEVFQAAREFASTRLRDALDQGASLDPQSRVSVAQQIADFLGLPRDRVLDLNLRVSDGAIFSGLMSRENQTVGRYDSRFLAPRIPGGEGSDPSSDIPGFVFAAGINGYLRTELNFQSTSPYDLSGDITSWPSDLRDEKDVMPAMSAALSMNPDFKVLIASGYFDLACPMETVAYEIRQMPGDASLHARVLQKKFFGGHMMYINPSALAELKTDIAGFMRGQASLVNGISPILATRRP